MNKYYCKLTDKSYSQATIDKNLSETYREVYTFEPMGACEGCLARGVCSAHIISQMRLKQLHLTSLIWSPELFFRSCLRCNTIVENVSDPKITKLLNFFEIKRTIQKYDPETYSKLPL